MASGSEPEAPEPPRMSLRSRSAVAACWAPQLPRPMEEASAGRPTHAMTRRAGTGEGWVRNWHPATEARTPARLLRPGLAPPSVKRGRASV
jgi:hypothetical protein